MWHATTKNSLTIKICDFKFSRRQKLKPTDHGRWKTGAVTRQENRLIKNHELTRHAWFWTRQGLKTTDLKSDTSCSSRMTHHATISHDRLKCFHWRNAFEWVIAEHFSCLNFKQKVSSLPQTQAKESIHACSTSTFLYYITTYMSPKGHLFLCM